MPTVNEDFLLHLLQACDACAPLFPARFAKQENLDRVKLDAGLDELRRRGLVQFTEWIKDAGQGYALTDAGRQALTAKRLPTGRVAPVSASSTSAVPNLYQRGEIARAALLGHGRPYACWALLIVNLLFFADGAVFVWRNDLSVMSYLQGHAIRHDLALRQDVPVLFDLGALWPDSTVPERSMRQFRKPEFERLLLFLFLHAGVLHLFMNMIFLGTLAGEIEAMWGWARFLAIYFVAGIVSGCVIILIDRFAQEGSVTVGASGPLYGVFTAMIIWFSLNYKHVPDNLLQEWSRIIGISSFMLVAANFVPHTSWQGHLGGAIGGLLAALLFHVQRFHPARGIRWLALAGVPLIPAAFFIAVLWQAGWF